MKILKKIYSFIKYFILRCIANDLSLYAAQASFFIIISAIPFLMLLLSFIQYIFPLNVEETIDFFIRTVPREMNRLLVVALYEIYPKSISAPLISVTALTALWSASRGMLALRKVSTASPIMQRNPYFILTGFCLFCIRSPSWR